MFIKWVTGQACLPIGPENSILATISTEWGDCTFGLRIFALLFGAVDAYGGSQCFPERLNHRDATPRIAYAHIAQGWFLLQRLSKIVSLDFGAEWILSVSCVVRSHYFWWFLVAFIAWIRFELKYLRECKKQNLKSIHMFLAKSYYGLIHKKTTKKYIVANSLWYLIEMTC